MSTLRRDKMQAANRFLDDLVRDLEHGKVHVEDLDGAACNRLEAMLRRRSFHSRTQDANRVLGDLLQDIERGDVHVEDFRDQLEALLRRHPR